MEGKMTRSPNLESVSTRLQRIAQLAREDRERAFLSLAHHIDMDWLREAYRLTRKDGAPGVDGQTAESYEENLEDNLRDLLNRFKSGAYKALLDKVPGELRRPPSSIPARCPSESRRSPSAPSCG